MELDAGVDVSMQSSSPRRWGKTLPRSRVSRPKRTVAERSPGKTEEPRCRSRVDDATAGTSAVVVGGATGSEDVCALNCVVSGLGDSGVSKD